MPAPTNTVRPTRIAVGRAFALAVLIAAPAGAAWRGAVPTPEPDVLRTELVIRPDIAGRRLDVEATLHIQNAGSRTSFTFLLADWYSSVEVTSSSGPASVQRDKGVVEVRVGRPSREERLVFRLSGMPGKSAGEERPVIDDDSLFLLWSDRFYPADFDDWALLRTQIELPESFQVLAPGCRTTLTQSGNRRVEVFETSEPIRAATILADTRWVAAERSVNGRRLRTLLHPAVQALSEHVLASSADVLGFYEPRFGPYAFDEFTFATVEGIFARRAVAGGVIYSPAYLDREMRSTGHDAHETALLWWFYTVAGRGPGSFQWIEGFGDYAEVLYDETRGLRIPGIFESFRYGYLRMAGTEEEPSIAEPNRGPRSNNYVHGRLPWLMHLLRFAAGDAAFDRAMRLLFDRWRFRSFTLEEFVATLAEGTGQSLDWWRSEWLDRKGVPELAWRSKVTPERGGFRVSLTIRQAGALYHLPLEIGIETDRGLRLERVRLEEPLREFQFFSAAEPRRVLVDPRRWLLAKITPD